MVGQKLNRQNFDGCAPKIQGDLAPEDLLKINEAQYKSRFQDLNFGHELATRIVREHGFTDGLVRIPEGSSLVFALDSDYFLKITPPFFDDALETELNALRIIGNQLPFPIPKIVESGQYGTWQYAITQRVPGEQAKNVFKSFTPENLMTFATDIGSVIDAINGIKSNAFKRKIGDWDYYLNRQLKFQKEIHLRRGNSEEWSDRIDRFVATHTPDLLSLKSPRMIHADLNHDHLMMNLEDGQWRVSGLIDFADAMNAPIELEFILPILCFFKGKLEHQLRLFDEAQVKIPFQGQRYSNFMMALTLQNRFIAFHDWFSDEIKAGAESVEDIAEAIFPPIST